MVPSPTLVTHPLVVQHNALVNARFDLNTTEARMFLAMLTRIKRDDTSFTKCELSVREILDQGSSQNYGHVRKVLEKFASRLITIETLDTGGKRMKQRTYSAIPLLARADYIEGEGQIVLRFNDELHDYLLELHDNFTKAQLTELMKLKSAASYRIYWLLREYAAFGKRTMQLDELKSILGLSEGYDRFNNFRARVLERAKEELAETDLPFTYSTISKGRLVTHIEFLFKPIESATSNVFAQLPGAPISEWATAVLAAGVSPGSLLQIQERVSAGDYDEGYVHYVLNTVKAQVKIGKVKNEGGAVFKALTDGYMLQAYRKSQHTVTPPKAKVNPAIASKRKKLLSELEDAHGSLQFVKTAVIYTEETRPDVIARVQEVIANLEQQLKQIGG
ncbi:replication initiation protein [Hymenobacter artigasi]|nr:replication initiation protein [Hymenobacter artigasi]